MPRSSQKELPPPIVIPIGQGDAASLSREWLLSNRLGAYASASIAGANTRRYHGLLVAATRPPLGRIVALSCLLDQLIVGQEGSERVLDLATFEFEGCYAPDGRGCLVEFRHDVAPTWVYRCGDFQVVKELLLAEHANAVAIRYSIAGPGPARLRLRPFLALRDYHGLRQARDGGMSFTADGRSVRVENSGDGQAVRVSAGVLHAPESGPDPEGVTFHADGQWWRRFRYRGDLDRGQQGHEDLFTPGWLEAPAAPGQSVQLTAALGSAKELNFQQTLETRRQSLLRMVEGVRSRDQAVRRLAMAADAFIARRRQPGGLVEHTLLAGFHWFGDWGRDAMIALPGLLLETGQHDAALEVLLTFATPIDQGMVPNCFDEYGGPPRFNSVDASLWFVLACDAYRRATGDRAGWERRLAPAVETVLRAYHDGTRFGIRADSDGLLWAGDAGTQLTWMDVSFNGAPVTPRWGKAVEVNALWLEALKIAAANVPDDARRREYADWADRAAASFAGPFWNASAGCLFDCLHESEPDATIRPNQVIAVAMPSCPLPAWQQKSVVNVVQRELLTPFGLRTLAVRDPRYRGRYGASWESRDKAYHQGTVWAWLIGPFVQAYLRVHGHSPAARAQCRRWLSAFDDHLIQAGVGYVSEIFDGDPPHAPAGCIAQAWSVAEVLRAKLLAERTPARRPRA